MTGASPGSSESASRIDGTDSLRGAALHGGAYLVVREGAGIFIRLLGVVVVTRTIGAHDYGIYAGAVAFVMVLTSVAQMGMEVYLIRQPEEPSDQLYARVFTFLLVLSILATGVALGGAWCVGRVAPQTVKYLHVFEVLALSVPLNVLWAPAQAKIERAFGYRRMAWLELFGDLVLYGVAVPLALDGAGPWSLVVGFICWQASLLVGSFTLAGLVPRLSWSWSSSRDFLHHGLSYSASGWVDSLAGLANPIIVGRYFGPTGVGYVALAMRLVDTLAFAQRATWRLGLVALSRLHREPARLRRAIEEGMALQMLVTAAPLIGFALCAHWLVPVVFGSGWSASIAVFSVLALSRLLNSASLLEMALLFARAENATVAITAAGAAALLFVWGFLLVPHLGLWGYGLAQLLTVPAWLWVHHRGRRIVRYSYRPLWPWAIGLGPAVLCAAVRLPERLLLLIPGVLILALPTVRGQLWDYLTMARRALLRRKHGCDI